MIHGSVPRPASRKRGNVILGQLYTLWCGASLSLAQRAQTYLGSPDSSVSWSFALAAFSKAAAVQEENGLLWRELQ